jgi:hypothetical protein
MRQKIPQSDYHIMEMVKAHFLENEVYCDEFLVKRERRARAIRPDGQEEHRIGCE